MNWDETELLSLRNAARRLGVGASWLREQAERGVVPGLQAGKRCWLFDVKAVRDALLKLASEPVRKEGAEHDPQ